MSVFFLHASSQTALIDWFLAQMRVRLQNNMWAC